VAKRARAPVWLNRVVVDAIHTDQLKEHGGLAGLRDENALESALARPRQKWHYEDRVDVPALAAAYAYGFVRNHPYRDGNKRIGFLAMVTFLDLNGYDFSATDTDVVAEILALAAGTISEEDVANWISQHGSLRR
jgi:death on curing protein